MAMRRRTHRRKTTQETIINMAEARREISHALHLHRSSAKKEGTNFDNYYSNVKPNFVVNHSNYCDYYCYPLLETLPCPEPVWSTTAPSVLATVSPVFEATELVNGWGENDDDEAASYSWWLGFLNTLDCKSSVDNLGIGGGEHRQGGSGLGESPNVVNVELSDQVSVADEWLMFPTTEDQAE